MRYKKQWSVTMPEQTDRCLIQFTNNTYYHKNREKRWGLDRWILYPKEGTEPRKVKGYMTQPATLHSIRYYRYSEEGIPARIKRV